MILELFKKHSNIGENISVQLKNNCHPNDKKKGF